MKSSVLLLALLSLAPFAWTQRAGYTPSSISEQQPMRSAPSSGFEAARAQSEKQGPPPSQLQSADLAKLKQDANELASLAQSIPPDVDQTAKGMLPKDLDKKLKRIEKLSKQLRSRISP